MTKGKEYQIIAQGNWEQIAEVVRTAKKAIKETQEEPEDYFDEEMLELEERFLEVYSVPEEGESFKDYKSRFIEKITGTGAVAKISSLLTGRKIPFNFYLTQDEGESIFRVNNTIREKKYQTIIRASGDYLERGALVAETLKDSLEKNSVKHSYKTLDKLIEE